MKWVRRIFVYLFSIILGVSLIGIALATSTQAGLMHSSKIEGWLNQSNFYPNLETTIVSKAQSSIASNVPGGVSISKTVVQQAVRSTFPQSLLKQDVQTFLNSNYAWLEGKTAIPNFAIDLSGVKQEFAAKVADASVLAHLNGLPTCTAAQTLQLESANPLLLSCLPAGVSPQFESSQVSQQLVNNSGFLSNPVLTANTVSTKELNAHEPYYKKLSTLPKAYQLTQKLPWILGVVSFVSILGIVFCARSKRSGLKRISIVMLISGLLLIADKFATDAVFNKLKDQAFKRITNGQLQQSLTNLAHYIETELVKINLWFGIAYVALAIILFGILLLTRHRKPKVAKEAKGAPQTNNISALDRIQRQPDLRGVNPPTKVTQHTPKKRSGPRPPRLIQ